MTVIHRAARQESPINISADKVKPVCSANRWLYTRQTLRTQQQIHIHKKGCHAMTKIWLHKDETCDTQHLGHAPCGQLQMVYAH